MLVTPYGIATHQPAGGASSLVTPAVVNVKPFAVDMPGSDKWGTQTIPITGTTGALVVLISTASWTGDADGIASVSWAGDPVTLIAKHDGVAGRAGCAVPWAGWIHNGVTDGNLVITSATLEMTDIIGWLVSLDRMAVSPIGPNPVAAINTVTQETNSIDITVANAASLLLGMHGPMRSGSFPLTSNWAIGEQHRTGSIAGFAASKVPGAAGVVNFTGTTPVGFGTDDWGALAVEVLPA